MYQSQMDSMGLTSGGPSTVPIFSSTTGISQAAAPALPPRPYTNATNYGSYGNTGLGTYGGYGSTLGGMGGSFGGMMGGYGGYGAGYGGGYSGYGTPYGGGGFNRFGMNPYGDIESRFIQMAEESSRPAFQSIESVVNAIGSVAMMLENTFIALTSSFRAILGVAENFGRLRSLFAQFWSTFAIIRSINWLIRKVLVMLGIRTENEFKAWAEATLQTQGGSGVQDGRPPGSRASTWPILLFFGVVFSAPYIILRMLNGLSSSIQEKLTDPTTWRSPMKALAQFDFQATSPQEISFRANQLITIAPQAMQGTYWNSGWLMATTDGKQAGLIPVNYVKVYRAAPVNSVESDGLPQNSYIPAIDNTSDIYKAKTLNESQTLAPIIDQCSPDNPVKVSSINNGGVNVNNITPIHKHKGPKVFQTLNTIEECPSGDPDTHDVTTMPNIS